MAFRKSNVYLSLVNSYIIDSPQPSSINYWWNMGSLL
nr:cytochrome b [Saccharomyces cerevisiae]